MVSFYIANQLVSQSKSPSMPKFIHNYANADWDGMNSFFLCYNFHPCLASQDVKYVWKYLKEAINTAIGLFVPSICVQSEQQPKWFTPTLRHNLKCVHTLRRSYHSAPSQSKKVKLESAEVNLQHLMSESKSLYETALIQKFCTSNHAHIYQYISSLKKQSVLPGIMSLNGITANNDMDKAELFNAYFYSVFTPPCNVHSFPDTVYGCPPIIEKIDIDEQLVFNTLCSLDSTKATGIAP